MSRAGTFRTGAIAIGLSLLLLEGVADATSTTCTTTVVCAEYINSSSGVAIHGEANTGIGIRGTSNGSTGFYGASRAGSTFFPGVEGESLDQTGDDAAGAFGLTALTGAAAPGYGILSYGSVYGVYGDAAGSGNGSKGVPTSFGIVGADGGGTAGLDTNVGVFAASGHGTALLALANVTTSTTKAYSATFPLGLAVEAELDKSNSDAIAVNAYSSSIAVAANNVTTGHYVYLASNIFSPTYDIATNDFSVDDSGNVNATTFKTPHGTYVRTTGSSGIARISYATLTAAPVLEDSGEGRLVNGRGYVTLDPALADVIDKHRAYRVFLTPDGDSNVLYVTQKSPAGFLVCESRGGRSTLSFDYRIIAKPVDDDAQRLALAPPDRVPDVEQRRLTTVHPATTQQPLDPFARLRAHVGAARYERERKAAEKIESVP